jgi:hypothetical protein
VGFCGKIEKKIAKRNNATTALTQKIANESSLCSPGAAFSCADFQNRLPVYVLPFLQYILEICKELLPDTPQIHPRARVSKTFTVRGTTYPVKVLPWTCK